MNALPDEATYNLKAVVSETGLKPDTLRAWERRYGLPQPARSAGGHRVYSRRDIETIRWLAARQEEGLTIRHAVRLWRQMRAAGQDPLRARPLPADAVADEAAVQPLPAGGPIEEWRNRWIDACMAFNEPAAEAALNQAFALFSPEQVCLDLLQRGLAEIGQGWYEGRITVQQEHFASALAVRRLDALLLGAPPPVRQARILVGCPPQERHTFSPLLLVFLLRRQGWDALYLGVNLPREELVQTVRRARADLLILSAQQLPTASELLDLAKEAADAGMVVAYGGLVFNLLPSIRSRIPGHFLGPNLAEAPARVASLLQHPTPVPAAVPADPAYLEARQAFVERVPLIDAQTWKACAPLKIQPAHLTRANSVMADNIQAALLFGDIALAASDVSWLEGLLFNHRIPGETLQGYLEAYATAAADQLDERGAPIVTWLAGLLQAARDEAPQ